MVHLLDSVKLKLARAGEHLSAFDNEQGDWQEKTQFRKFVSRDYGNDRSYFLEIVSRPPAHLSAVLGDCIQNLRVSLDHLAWALVLANHKSPGKWTSFPIYRDPPKGTFRPDCVDGMNNDAIGIIETLQPYYGGRNPDTDFLWFVNSLANTDKHRTLNLVAAQTDVSAFRVYMQVAAGDTRVFSPPWLEKGVLRDGAKVATYPLNELRDGVEVKIEAEARGFMTLGEDLPWGTLPVEHHIGNAWAYIRHEVLPMFDRFF